MPDSKKILFAFIILSFLACAKEHGAVENARDTSAPTITITSPVSNQQFSSGQTIQVAAAATDNRKVTEMHIHVLNKVTGALLRDVHAYPDGQSGSVQDSFTAQAGFTYTIRIIANDPSQNIATAQVDITVN